MITAVPQLRRLWRCIAVVLQTALWFACASWAPAYAELHDFELDAPAARQVFLAGEMTNWDRDKLPMQRAAHGKWRVQVDLGPGQWLYKFVVDGQWIADPGTPDRDADGGGGQHSFVFIGKGAWSDLQGGPKGLVEAHRVDSQAFGRAMKVNVYLPPAFAADQPYPVLWLLHGGGMDADQWFKTGRIDRYMNNLIAQGQLRPFVVVMPSSGDLPYTGASETFITTELPAWLNRRYGLRPARAQTAVAGMSMGGTGAIRLPLRRPDLYGASFSLSGYFGDELIATLPRSGGLPMQTSLICGSEDELLMTNRKLVQALNAAQAKFVYREDKGGHTWQYWSQHTVEMLIAADAYFDSGARGN